MKTRYQYELDRIQLDFYDPENDIATPRVSHVEMTLVEIIRELDARIKELETIVAESGSHV